MNEKYMAIIAAERPVTDNHKRMANIDRAAQFAAFAALTGYGDSVEETARFTDARPELLEDEKSVIDARLRAVKANLAASPRVGLTVFLPDPRKPGGRLKEIIARVRAINENEGAVVFEDGSSVKIDDIVRIDPLLSDGLCF